MEYKLETLVSRIDERLAALNLSDRAASIKATGSPDAIRYIKKRNAWPSARRLAWLALTLKATPNYLVGRTDKNDWEDLDDDEISAFLGDALDQLHSIPEPEREPPEAQTTAGKDLKGNIPLLESKWKRFEGWVDLAGRPVDIDVASANGAEISKTLVAPEGCRGEPIAIINSVEGMEPAINVGDLIFVDMRKPPAKGDLVLVRVNSDETEISLYNWDYFPAYFVGRTRESAIFRQLRSDEPFAVPENREFRINRIMSNAELWGV